jgi:uncharacterized protein
MSVAKLLTQIKNDSDIWLSPIHGINHWDRVMDNALMVGETNGADLKVIEYFAYLHDSCRVNDGRDPEHGPRAAAYAKNHREIFELNDQQFKVLTAAVSGHTHAFPSGKAGNNPTLAACWDGDRLDLPRVEITPDPNLLFSNWGKYVATTDLNTPNDLEKYDVIT